MGLFVVGLAGWMLVAWGLGLGLLRGFAVIVGLALVIAAELERWERRHRG